MTLALWKKEGRVSMTGLEIDVSRDGVMKENPQQVYDFLGDRSVLSKEELDCYP